MKHTTITRRRFLGSAAAASAGLSLGLQNAAWGADSRPALLGGTPVRTADYASWPVFDQQEEQALLEALRSGRWGRLNGKKVAEFEQRFRDYTGMRYCVSTASGTTALLTALGSAGVGPGDEVILPPYTFIATYNVIVGNYALPVFVDSDPETFLIDAKKISGAITDRTKLLLPVHIGGSAADMDTVMAAARPRQLTVIEDACQAWVAQWRGRAVGSASLAGCVSFQASKNLTAGEGGAVLTNDEDFANRCYNYHNQGRGRPSTPLFRGANFRLTEFQGAVLLSQLTRLEQQSRTREQNAAYLTELLGAIPGIKPARMYEGCTRNAYHLYMFRYQKEHFADMSRAKFLQALAREGVSASGGYTALNKDSFVTALATNPYYLKIYGEKTMASWVERNQCPVNDKLCTEAVWFTQNRLLGPRSDMEQIAEAVRKIQRHAGEIARS